jgi:hypothetical protein
MNLIYLIPIILIPIIVRILEACNFHILLKGIGKKISILKLTKYLFYTWAVGAFTPGKTGQFAMILFLNKEKISRGESFMITILDKSLTILVLVVFSLFGLYKFFQGIQQLIVYSMIILALISMGLLMFNERIKKHLREKVFRRYSRYFKGFSKSLNYLVKTKKKIIFLNMIITSIKWILSISIIYLTFLSFNYKVEFWITIVIVSVSNLIALIPISLAGLGLKETSGAYLFSKIGYSFSIAATSMLIFTALRYLYAFFFMLIFFIKGEDFGVKEFLNVD